ncbi:MAG: hypothetical protein I8H71_00995 [Xanthomonadaceae bacterium]|nr:hypothetical protein [Xanthomonadaceae bacterium]
MIEHTEKGAGLIARIEDAGHAIWCLDGVWSSSDDAAVQVIIDGYTIDEAKAYKQNAIALHAKALRDRVIATISVGEMAAWPIKMSEASAYATSGSIADAPMLAAEALARRVSLAELCAKVTEKAATFAGAEAAIAGVDGLHRDAVAACVSFADVAEYDYSGGWPVV